jgi:hypothetical protein
VAVIYKRADFCASRINKFAIIKITVDKHALRKINVHEFRATKNATYKDNVLQDYVRKVGLIKCNCVDNVLKERRER